MKFLTSLSDLMCAKGLHEYNFHFINALMRGTSHLRRNETTLID
jgi:hypothetical protein